MIVISNLSKFLIKTCYYSGLPLEKKHIRLTRCSLVCSIFLTLYIVIDILMKLLLKTEMSLEEKLLCAQNILIFLSIFMARFEFMRKSEYLSDIINDLDQEGSDNLEYDNNISVTELIDNFPRKKSDRLQKIAGFIFEIVCIMGLFSFFFPVVVGLFIILKNNQSESSESLPLLIPSYHSYNSHSLLFYLLKCIVHFVIIYFSISFGTTTIIMSFCSVHAIASDLRWLCNLAEKLNTTAAPVVDSPNMFNKIEIDRQNEYHSNIHQENEDLLRFIVLIHKNVRRKIHNLNKGLGLVNLLMCNTFCFEICVCIYCTIQVDEIQVKFQYVMLLTPVTYTMYALCNYGQSLINESENFQNALWSTAWTDMPTWKQKNVQIVMTLASVQLEMRGCGVFVMNLKMFSSIMHAAYSYYSLLNAI
ncbi:hypothetical protein LSTR_LSTR009672 [Laodelphax striatellus]|uniref:Odorant receptor n=1 Tax=Laodelphax striatellus TaxID=195883 RepID=A0A482WPY9_LAOST|nr:hypothetical protein LSTR_LSTR009672 [Laodelphax striatellus]